MNNESVSKTPKIKFGWVKGVYIPSILTIFGVIMYLRMGWVLGQVGIIGTLAIVTLSCAITFLTSLSISSMATNMRVEGGGAYFMISRSFGVEAGAAIGIPLFFAQSLGIAFYISGFTESVFAFFPYLPQIPFKLLITGILGYTAFKSTSLALKTQGVILSIIVLSLISFFLGTPQTEIANSNSSMDIVNVGFWAVFAVFFPAVTGIEAGLSMSGELKEPSKALPLGTIASVFTGFLVYMAIPIFLYKMNIPSKSLMGNQLIMQELSWIPILVILGLWGSTLSSALGALLGAPRTLQALAKDRIVFSFFSKGEGEEDIPQRATIFSVVLCCSVYFLGDLNTIASLLSMFFLTSYGFLNLAACLEGIMDNPSWRPTFKTPFWISLLGGFGCLAAMLLIDAASTFAAIALVFCIYIFTKKRQLGRHWSDIRRGMLLTAARRIVYKLDEMSPDARTWRPHIYALSGSPQNRWPLIRLAHSLTLSKGFLTLGALFEIKDRDAIKRPTHEKEQSVKDFLDKRGVKSLVNIHHCDNVWEDMEQYIQGYGLGKLKPNTLLLGCSENKEHLTPYLSLVRNTYFLGKNLIMIKTATGSEDSLITATLDSERIDVWWGREKQNASLMLALAHLIQQSQASQKSKIYLKTTIRSEEERSSAEQVLNNFISESRLSIYPEVHLMEKHINPFQLIQEQSKDADLVFMGIKAPEEKETPEDFKSYYLSLMEKTKDLPQSIFVLAAESINFKEIFE